MKVLVYEHYDYGIHGNQRYLMLLLDRIQCLYGSDLNLTLVVPTEGVFFRAADAGADNVLALKRKSLIARSFFLGKILRTLRPDVILCNNEASLLTVLPAAFFLRIKLIWQVKNMRRLNWSDALCFVFAMRVLAIAHRSIDVKNPYIAGWFKRKIHIQPIGTRIQDFLTIPEPSSHQVPLRLLALIFVSRSKGIDTLVETLEHLDARGSHVNVRIAGVTPAGGERLEKELKQRTADFNRVTVEWLGWRDDVRDLLEWCHVLVHPSRADGVPRCIVEAMASGRPVIASDVGGIPDSVTDAGEGFLIKAGDTRALADRIQRLAENSQLRFDMGRAGRLRAKRDYDIDSHVERLKAHFDAVVAGG